MSGTFPGTSRAPPGSSAWALLAAATLWGLALSTKVLGRRPRPNWLLDLHRWLGGTALIFTGVHVVALLADQYVALRLELDPRSRSRRSGIRSRSRGESSPSTSCSRSSSPRSPGPACRSELWRRVHIASFVLFVMATSTA